MQYHQLFQNPSLETRLNVLGPLGLFVGTFVAGVIIYKNGLKTSGDRFGTFFVGSIYGFFCGYIISPKTIFFPLLALAGFHFAKNFL